jgi:hypothetical protein
MRDSLVYHGGRLNSVTLTPGYKTTEFLITVATVVGLVFASSADWLPPRYAALGAAISTGAYALARGLAKINQPTPSK